MNCERHPASVTPRVQRAAGRRSGLEQHTTSLIWFTAEVDPSHPLHGIQFTAVDRLCRATLACDSAPRVACQPKQASTRRIEGRG